MIRIYLLVTVFPVFFECNKDGCNDKVIINKMRENRSLHESRIANSESTRLSWPVERRARMRMLRIMDRVDRMR